MKYYADTDFFLAIFKEKDWLKAKAMSLAHHNISTSVSTAIELLLLAKKHSLEPERTMSDLLTHAVVEGILPNQLLAAAHYVQVENLTVLDAFHAAYCGNRTIISSDQRFDKLGMRRIKLESK
ncbi:pilus assembly protein [Candidatus Woesearchaeota archaeon]|nr:pilus assembly protein [Candidatus Woesearchaeota archaeon]|tara:strand:- start:184 stop:552 length:369 start_codon:yes stop_codon:yes gene_type:complete